MTHLDFMTLDRLALGEAADPVTQAHLDECDECRAHVAAVATPAEVPGWLDAVEAEAPQAGRGAGAIGVAAVAAVAAALMLAPVTAPDEIPVEAPEYETRRGGPAVGVFRRRAGAVSLWDGREAFVSGDEIRLRVAGDGFRHVAVFGRNGGAWALLHAGEVEEGETTLPGAWRLDGAREDERLLVILGDAPIEDPSEGEWRREVRLPREGGTQ